MFSSIVLDLDTSENTDKPSDLWGATYNGGLIQIHTNRKGLHIRNWTRWDGLPDDRVLSVSVDDDVTWVGMATGLAKIYDGKVLQVWDDELVDPYVQTDLKDGVVYIGTHQGLITIGIDPEHLLPAWSVFSLLTDGNKPAVGYEGITFIDERQSINTRLTRQCRCNRTGSDALWMATETKGLVQSTKEGTRILSDEPINDILQIEDRVYVAGKSRVWSLPTQPTEDDELKGELVGISSIMYTLANYHDQLWVGTEDGLSSFTPKQTTKSRGVPTSHWSTTQTIYGLLPTEEYGLLASLEYRFIPMSIQGERLPLRLLEDNVSEAKHQDSNGFGYGPSPEPYRFKIMPGGHTLPSHLVGITDGREHMAGGRGWTLQTW